MRWLSEKFGAFILKWKISLWLSILALIYSAACMHVTLWEPVIIMFLIIVLYLARIFAHIEGEEKYKVKLANKLGEKK
jgi:hypothetical protein